jgi:uncharacterized protein YqgC (DUF456 family)
MIGSMSRLEPIIGLVMLAGLVGIVVPVVPGLALIWGAALIWALGGDGDPTRWVAFGVITAIGVIGGVAAAILPARRASGAGAPGWVIAVGAVGMIVGFFLIPVVGALVGGPVAVYVAELARLRDASAARRTTIETLKGFGIGVAVQLAAGVVMIVVWGIAVWAW